MNIKLFIFALLLITSINVNAFNEQLNGMIDNAIETTVESAFEDQASPQTLVKAINCLVEGKNQIVDLVNLVKNLVGQKYISAIKNTVDIVKRTIQMLDDCQTLFCYGPTYKKCERDHGENNCEKTGLIVYPKCAEGMKNFGCCICHNKCPQGWRDDGLFCKKPAAYGRGAGYVLWKRSKCESQNPQGCEKVGLIWYPKCAPGYHRVGCCICSPDCPSGWTDIGISCAKPTTYGRGVGYPVSFGFKCMAEYDEQKKLQAVDCNGLEQNINDLREIVEIKYERVLAHPDRYEQGLADYIKDLSMKIEIYAEQCVQKLESLE